MIDMFGYDPDETPATHPPKMEEAKPRAERDDERIKKKGNKKGMAMVHQTGAGLGATVGAGAAPGQAVAAQGKKSGGKRDAAAAPSSEKKIDGPGDKSEREGRDREEIVSKGKAPITKHVKDMPPSPKKPTAEDMERERKLFMSPNASKIHLTAAQDEEMRLKQGPLLGKRKFKEEENFGSIAASVAELGASAFWGEWISLSFLDAVRISIFQGLTCVHAPHVKHDRTQEEKVGGRKAAVDWGQRGQEAECALQHPHGPTQKGKVRTRRFFPSPRSTPRRTLFGST